MRCAYYYFVASLPTLDFGLKPLWSLPEFLNQCRQYLSVRDFQMIQKAVFGESLEKPQRPLKNIVWNSWTRFNQALRNELAWFRALRADKDPALYLRGQRPDDPMFGDVVAQAKQAPDPLAAERVLDRFRWQHLDELIFGHYFDVEVLMIYAFKLQILERYQTIASERGQEIFAEYQTFEMPAFHD